MLSSLSAICLRLGWRWRNFTRRRGTGLFQDLRWCVGLSTGRVGSVLDPTRTRPAGVGWKAEGSETDRRCHSVGSVRSVLRVAGSCKRRRNLQKIRQNLQKLSRSAPKIAKISLDLLESRRISPNLAWMSPDLTKSRLNVAGYCLICI